MGVSGQVINRFNITRFNTGSFHFFSVIRNLAIHSLNTLDQTLSLQLPDLLIRHCLSSFIPDITHSCDHPSILRKSKIHLSSPGKPYIDKFIVRLRHCQVEPEHLPAELTACPFPV
jgi:hypothetical protein